MPASCDGSRVKNADVVMPSILFGIRLLPAACDIQNIGEQFLSLLGNCFLSEGSGACIIINDIGPLLLHLTAGADLDYR